jgi:hypothetical protein
MLKVALLVATALACVPPALATTAGLDPVASHVGDASCRLVSPSDVGCALRIVDPTVDTPLSLADAANATALSADWVDPHPTAAAGDFKDAAIGPRTILPATLERDTRRRLVPALFALGAMIVLLRRRPTSF